MIIKTIADTAQNLKEIFPNVTPEQVMAIHNIIITVDHDAYDRGYDTGLKVGKEFFNCSGCNKG